MPGEGTAAAIAQKLVTLLRREPALRGGELEAAVSEKERMVSELEKELARVGLESLGSGDLADLSFANGLVLKLSRLRLQLNRIQNSEAPAAPRARVDIIS